MRFRSSAIGIHDTIWIPPNVLHRFINASDRPLRIFWTSATIDAEHVQAPGHGPLCSRANQGGDQKDRTVAVPAVDIDPCAAKGR